MAVKVNIDLSVKVYKKLADFLTEHETEIANKVDDFHMLRDLFVVVYEEEPKKITHVQGNHGGTE
jgi:hypothetical protein